MLRTYGTPHIAVYIYQPLKWQATFVLPLWGVFGGIFAYSYYNFSLFTYVLLPYLKFPKLHDTRRA